MAESIKKRYLATSFAQSAFEDLPDGGLIVRDVPLLRSGQWTDSAVGTPLFYPLETLRKYATNWAANPYWNRHSGGSPHAITDKIADIVNPRFQEDGIYADLKYHGATTQSQDAIKYLKYASKNGIEVFSSVEHSGEEEYNAAERRMDAKTLVFFGAAMVNRGACQTCQIPRVNEEKTLADSVAGYVPPNPPDYGIAPESQAWSALNLSDFTSGTWESMTETEQRDTAKHYAYAGSLDTFGALKLPHHDKSGAVVWAGVAAAYASLQGARGGVKIPDDIRPEVEAHILAHYADFDKDTPSKELETKMTEEMELRVKTLSDKLDALTGAVQTLVEEKQAKALEASAEAKKKELSDAVAAQTRALMDRIDALEKDTTPTTGTKPAVKELGDPINAGYTYAKDGVIRSA
ncbi:MAG: hypothetical protein WC096_02670 [Sphaerochaetaceae bacterium]